MASTQFKSTDTTPWWLGLGDGSDGAYSSVGNATDAPVDSSCSGTVGATSLTATNASFANGKPILIHQSRGTGAGAWELNQIASYVAGTITLVSPLKNTYTDSGASQAQVIQLKQYSSFTQDHILTAKNWNENVGGIIAFLCNGEITGTGTISLAGDSAENNVSGVPGVGVGFKGGQATKLAHNTTAYSGEGTSGTPTQQTTPNGNGGGGGRNGTDVNIAGMGGGGGNGTGGANGQQFSQGVAGEGGPSAGNAALTNAVFGGGGGGSSRHDYDPSGGGAGGGFLLMIGRELTLTSLTINLNGGNAGTAHAYGGGGAGGSCLLKAHIATLGTNKITASAGGGGGTGGSGGVGRIHLDYLISYTGTTTPTIDVTQDISLSDRKSSMLLNLL
jgi:hypothetical protein